MTAAAALQILRIHVCEVLQNDACTARLYLVQPNPTDGNAPEPEHNSARARDPERANVPKVIASTDSPIMTRACVLRT